MRGQRWVAEASTVPSNRSSRCSALWARSETYPSMNTTAMTPFFYESAKTPSEFFMAWTPTLFYEPSPPDSGPSGGPFVDPNL